MPTFRCRLEDPLVMEKIKQGNYFAFQDFDPYKLNDALKAKASVSNREASSL